MAPRPPSRRPRTMRRDQGRRRIYRSRAMRRRRSLFVVCIVVSLAGLVLVAGQSGVRSRTRNLRPPRGRRLRRRVGAGQQPAVLVVVRQRLRQLRLAVSRGRGLRPLQRPRPRMARQRHRLPDRGLGELRSRSSSACPRATAAHTRYIARTTGAGPSDWAAGDIVYLGNTVAGKPEWQHVIICVGKAAASGSTTVTPRRTSASR